MNRDGKHYGAPWGRTLVVSSVLVTLFVLGMAFGALRLIPPLPAPLRVVSLAIPWMRWWLVSLIPLCALFTVRGYTLAPDAILVHRPFWNTRLPRAGLESARFVPDAMRRSIRLCGNGGFFSFTGLYWKKPLGRFQAFVTDLNRTVVLRYAGRTVVVSPDDPEQFARDVSPEN